MHGDVFGCVVQTRSKISVFTIALVLAAHEWTESAAVTTEAVSVDHGFRATICSAFSTISARDVLELTLDTGMTVHRFDLM